MKYFFKHLFRHTYYTLTIFVKRNTWMLKDLFYDNLLQAWSMRNWESYREKQAAARAALTPEQRELLEKIDALHEERSEVWMKQLNELERKIEEMNEIYASTEISTTKRNI